MDMVVSFTMLNCVSGNKTMEGVVSGVNTGKKYLKYMSYQLLEMIIEGKFSKDHELISSSSMEHSGSCPEDHRPGEHCG